MSPYSTNVTWKVNAHNTTATDNTPNRTTKAATEETVGTCLCKRRHAWTQYNSNQPRRWQLSCRRCALAHRSTSPIQGPSHSRMTSQALGRVCLQPGRACFICLRYADRVCCERANAISIRNLRRRTWR